jgi:hypothetical protein
MGPTSYALSPSHLARTAAAVGPHVALLDLLYSAIDSVPVAVSVGFTGPAAAL